MSAPQPALANVAGVILAAGKGTRMKSMCPKVLHEVAGRSMLAWVEHALGRAGIAERCVILSEELAGFEEFLAARPELTVAIQKNRLGTGDAVAAAAHAFCDAPLAPYAAGRLAQGRRLTAEAVLICAGDTPALDAAELAAFIAACQKVDCAVGVLGMRLSDPTGYGRLVVAQDELTAIVEERDATADQRQIDVVNSGIIYARTAALFALLGQLRPNNSQNEYYLTDIVAAARAEGLKTYAHVARDARAFAGVNDRRQLAELESLLVARHVEALMLGGVTVHSPHTVHVDATVQVDADCELGPGVVLRGKTHVGQGCRLGPHVVVEHAKIGSGAKIGAGSIVSGVELPEGTIVPPASVRLGSQN